jgi:hypothetical protein
MAVREGSDVQLEEHMSEDVGSELLLGFGVLESLLPIGGGSSRTRWPGQLTVEHGIGATHRVVKVPKLDSDHFEDSWP